MEISKRDWKLFREKLAEWQECYMVLFSTLKEAVFVKLNEVKTAWCCVCQSH